MNKRQAKKKYKKEYGHNPPKIISQNTSLLFDALCGIGESFTNAISDIGKYFTDMSKLFRNAVNNMQTMEQEEFNEKCSLLTPEQRAVAYLIRDLRKKR